MPPDHRARQPENPAAELGSLFGMVCDLRSQRRDIFGSEDSLTIPELDRIDLVTHRSCQCTPFALRKAL